MDVIWTNIPEKIKQFPAWSDQDNLRRDGIDRYVIEVSFEPAEIQRSTATSSRVISFSVLNLIMAQSLPGFLTLGRLDPPKILMQKIDDALRRLINYFPET